MDDKIHPLKADKLEHLWSDPLLRFSQTRSAADTAVEVSILWISRFWKWGQTTSKKRTPPRDFGPHVEAHGIIASVLVSAFLAGVESWVVDACLPEESWSRKVYALGYGVQRTRVYGVLSVSVYQAFSGIDVTRPQPYLPARLGEYGARAAHGLTHILWRLIQFKTGPDILFHCIPLLEFLVYGCTLLTVRYFADISLAPSLGIWTSALISLLVLLVVSFPRFLLDAVARLPEANTRNTRRAATVIWTGGLKRKAAAPVFYTHSPLKRARDIRLLQLMPRNGLRGNVVRAELLHTSLDMIGEYDCLSYTWGDLSKINDRYILVDGKRFNCSPKVHQMLLDLTCSRERLLWIDLFCINQADPVEKGQQVAMMKDIYRGAAEVIAWLEPLHDIQAMKRVSNGWALRTWNWILHPFRSAEESLVLEDIRQGPGHDHIVRMSPFPKSVTNAMVSLFLNDWFTRAWIIQEVVMAKHPVEIHYGDQRLAWKEVSSAAWAITSYSRVMYTAADIAVEDRPRIWRAVRAAAIVNNLGFRIQQGLSVDLAEALQECSLFNASFPEDKVFALMGFTGDSNHRGILPAYDQPVNTVYTSTAAYLYSSAITNHYMQSTAFYPLRVLHSAGVGLERRIAGLPSWTPDWSTPWPSTILSPSEITDRHMGRYRASGDSTFSGGLSVTNEGMVLRLAGAIVDEIAFVTDPFNPPISRHTLDDPYSPVLFGTQGIAADDINSPYARDFHAILDWHRQGQQLRENEIADPYPHGGPTTRGQSAQDAFWLTLVGNFPFEIPGNTQRVDLEPGTAGYESFLSAGRQCLSVLEDNENNPEGFKAMALRFSPTYIHVGRRFATTEDGYMALVPGGARPGDLVCVLFGAQTPFLLRRSGAQAQAQQAGFELVGECYVHGMMEGERAPTEVQAEWFHIF